MSEFPKEEENNLASQCPPGYTWINGQCVKDVTPPPPNVTDSED